MIESSSAQTVLWVASSAKRTPDFEEVEQRRELRVLFARDMTTALEILRENPVKAILIQLPFAGWQARDLLSQVRQHGGEAPVILNEPDGCLANGAVLIRGGAFHCISQPATVEQLCEVLMFAILDSHDKAIPAIQPVPTGPSVDNWRNLLVGSSTAMREVVEIIRMVANRRSTILITGETGTGKEVAARAIHMASGRSTSRMVAINCAALPENLL
jgi:DNA-binding NtrC family response regulator